MTINKTDIDMVIPLSVSGFSGNELKWVTEAIVTYYMSGKYTGTIDDIGVYSFNGNKIITTGVGSMIVSNNGKFSTYRRVRTSPDMTGYSGNHWFYALYCD